MVTTDFRPEVELWLFCTRAVKNTQYDRYLWPNRQNFYVLREIGVQELDGDVTYYTGNGNVTILCMHNEKCAI